MKKQEFKPHLMYRGNSIKMANTIDAHKRLKAKGYNHNQPKKLTFNKK